MSHLNGLSFALPRSQDKLLSKMEVDEGDFPLPTGSGFGGVGGSAFDAPIAANSKGEPIATEDDEVRRPSLVPRACRASPKRDRAISASITTR